MVTRLERASRVNTDIDSKFRDKWFKWIVSHTDKVNWSVLTYHEYITPEFILANPEYPWDLQYMSLNPNLTMDFINKHPEIPWNYSWISESANITLDDIKQNSDKDWNWYYISRNPNMTMDIIRSNPDMLWNWNGMSYNPNITFEFVRENADKPWNLHELNVTFKLLGYISSIHSIEALISFMESPFYINIKLGKIEEIDLDSIQVDDSEKWLYMSSKMNINSEFIANNIDKPWNWHKMGHANRTLTLDFVKLYYDKLGIYNIIYNPNVSLDILEYIMNDNLYSPLHIWSIISYNNNLTTEFIDKYLVDNNPVWSAIACRVHNITFDFIDKHIDKGLNWDHISKSLFETERTNHRLAECKRYLAAYRIQQWWHRIRLDPHHSVGRRRLEREYTALFGPEAL